MQDADLFLTKSCVSICNRFAEFVCQPEKKIVKINVSLKKFVKIDDFQNSFLSKFVT